MPQSGAHIGDVDRDELARVAGLPGSRSVRLHRRKGGRRLGGGAASVKRGSTLPPRRDIVSDEERTRSHACGCCRPVDVAQRSASVAGFPLAQPDRRPSGREARCCGRRSRLHGSGSLSARTQFSIVGFVPQRGVVQLTMLLDTAASDVPTAVPASVMPSRRQFKLLTDSAGARRCG